MAVEKTRNSEHKDGLCSAVTAHWAFPAANRFGCFLRSPSPFAFLRTRLARWPRGHAPQSHQGLVFLCRYQRNRDHTHPGSCHGDGGKQRGNGHVCAERQVGRNESFGEIRDCRQGLPVTAHQSACARLQRLSCSCGLQPATVRLCGISEAWFISVLSEAHRGIGASNCDHGSWGQAASEYFRTANAPSLFPRAWSFPASARRKRFR